MLTRHVSDPDPPDLDAVVAAWLADLDRQRAAGGCADPVASELLARVAIGEAPSDLAAQVYDHLAECLLCLNAYAALAGAAHPETRAPAPLPRQGAFVGRQRELDVLLGALDRVRRGGSSAVCLAGAAGIGKSRLLETFRSEAQSRGARVLRARCTPRGSSAPYRPLLDLIRDLCGFDELDHDDLVRRRIDAAVRAAGLSPAGTVPFVAQIAGLAPGREPAVVPEPGVMKEKLAQCLRALIVQASQGRPVVVELEDLQWCDAASASCLASMGQALGAGRVLLVGTCRSGRPIDWLEALGAATITVPPLAPPEAAALLAAMIPLGAVAPSLVPEMASRAGGNPLLLEELAFALRSPAAPAQVLATAGSAQELLSTRLATLGDRAASLLRAAAVIGIHGSLDVLADVSAGHDVPVDPSLAELESSGFLVSAGDGEEREFRFRHAVIQEVVYRAMAPLERQAWHESVMRVLEARGDQASDLDTLAHHAGLSGNDDRAVDYALRVAARMIRRAANAEALLALEAAASRLAQMPDTPANRLRRIDVVLDGSEARFGIGQHAEQLRALREIEPLLESAADARRLATWHYWLGFLHTLTGGNPTDAIAHCRAASRIADSAQLEDIYAYSELCLCQALATAGELREAMEAGKRALGIFERTRNAWWSCRTLWHLASGALNLGQWRESAAFCQRALDHGRSVSDSRLMAVAWLRLAAAHVHRGEWETGILFCDEAARLPHTEFDAAMLRVNRGYALVRGRQYEAGIASIQAGRDWFQQAGLRLSELNAQVRLAEAHLRAGAHAEAAPLAEAVATAAQALGYSHLVAVAQAIVGEALITADPPAARRALDAAEPALEEIGALGDLARVRAARAQLSLSTGDSADAVMLLASAVRLLEGLEAVDELGRVRAALARAQGRPRK